MHRALFRFLSLSVSLLTKAYYIQRLNRCDRGISWRKTKESRYIIRYLHLSVRHDPIGSILVSGKLARLRPKRCAASLFIRRYDTLSDLSSYILAAASPVANNRAFGIVICGTKRARRRRKVAGAGACVGLLRGTASQRVN